MKKFLKKNESKKFKKIFRENGVIHFDSIKEFKKNKSFINIETKGFKIFIKLLFFLSY